ncbi:unnamed protein product [Paramecium sonneborni]|uniref:Transmembrane protein n=1 Tax=Paramecium sonneborni TaxID=65129 RepID=A0A8S1K9N6_9CILI|nr:unnamed protein product [Paramecium sonneborni]
MEYCNGGNQKKGLQNSNQYTHAQRFTSKNMKNWLKRYFRILLTLQIIYILRILFIEIQNLRMYQSIMASINFQISDCLNF